MSIIIKGITKAQFYKDTNKIPYMDVGWDIEELPPHGRLIDADALKVMMPSIEDEYLYAQDLIDEMPTILEAEEGKQ